MNSVHPSSTRPMERSSIRQSITSRMPHLFEGRQDQGSSDTSHRTSGACEVPIFMSPSSDHLDYPHHEELARSPLGRRSEDYYGDRTVPASSVYSQSPNLYARRASMEEIEEESRSTSPDSTHDLEAGLSASSRTASEVELVKEKRRGRKRVAESYREKIASKKRLGMAFGVTTLAAVITYLVLAVTGAAKGIMFHVLSVVFILILMGVFLHNAVRLVMLQQRRRARLARHRDWHGSRSISSSTSSSRSRSATSVKSSAEKPIRIIEDGDEIITTTPRGKNKRVVRPPPPVYGNFRGSKRISPEMLFWQKQNPSPTTPTYEEALNDVQTAVGYMPPQYTSPKRYRMAVDPGQRVSDIHPLERGRLAGLMGNTMSSQRPVA